MITIIEVQAQDNGAHRNCISDIRTIPDGWAKVPDDMKLENFPFGEVTVKKINGVMTVTKWVAGKIPEEETPEPTPSEMEQLRADVDYIAIMTGVEL